MSQIGAATASPVTGGARDVPGKLAIDGAARVRRRAPTTRLFVLALLMLQ